MNFSVMFLELILPLDAKAFDELVDNAYSKTKKNKIVETEYGFSDEVLFSHGIGIAYLGHNKKRKIKLIIHPGMVIDNNSVDDHWEVTSSKISKFIRKLSLHINDYFDSEYELDDFALSRIDFVADVDVGNRETASDYIKILHNIGKVKCFSSVKREKRGNVKGNSFELKGKSNGLEFKAHRLEKEKNILRFEIRLIKRDAIRACSDEAATENVIEDVFNKSKDIFKKVFRYVIPAGDYYKKNNAVEIIEKKITDRKMKTKMFRLLSLIPEKKSLHLAIKAMNDRNIKDVFAAFEEINLSPVTISKRQNVSYLKSLYFYLFKD